MPLLGWRSHSRNQRFTGTHGFVDLLQMGGKQYPFQQSWSPVQATMAAADIRAGITAVLLFSKLRSCGAALQVLYSSVGSLVSSGVWWPYVPHL